MKEIRSSWAWSNLWEELPAFLERIGVNTKNMGPPALIGKSSADPVSDHERFETVLHCLRTIFSKMYPTRATDVIDGEVPRRPTDTVLETKTRKILNFITPGQFSPPDDDRRILISEIAFCKCGENRHKGMFCVIRC